MYGKNQLYSALISFEKTRITTNSYYTNMFLIANTTSLIIIDFMIIEQTLLITQSVGFP